MVEESGEKWSIEHLYVGDRNAQTTISCILPNLHSGLYLQTSYLSNLYSLKTPINFVQFCENFVQFCKKKYIKVWKISEKPGKKVCLS
jgi:hypothetical protein